MIRVVDLLDRDFSRPIEETIKVDGHVPAAVFTELTEYIATDRIRKEYERLLPAMAAAVKCPTEAVGIWISGSFGSGKSSFARNIGYILANRDVLGVSAKSIVLEHLESRLVPESVDFLNRTSPHEIFMLDVQAELGSKTNSEQIAEVMYRVLLRNLDYAEDSDVAELEIELEKGGRLAAFQSLCREEYKEEWREVRRGNEKLALCSKLLHRFDPLTYASPHSWLNTTQAGASARLSTRDLVERMFDLCEIRRAGKTFAFVLDDIGQWLARGRERLDNLQDLVEQIGKQGLVRVKGGRIAGPAWIIITAEDKLENVYQHRNGPREIQGRWKHRIDLSEAGLSEIVTCRVLRKKQTQEAVLRDLFSNCGAQLIQSVKLESCSRRTDFSEDEFVRFYPYLPHLIDLSIDIVAGLMLHPNAPKQLAGNRSIVKQTFEMLVSDRTRLAGQPIGALVSIDKIYDLLEGSIPPEKQHCVRVAGAHPDNQDYPGMAARVAKAICLMEFAGTDLPRTMKNIAALLVQRVAEAPPTPAVYKILKHLNEAYLLREGENGWTLYDFEELRRAAAALEELNNQVGIVNPRLPGWRNDLIQLAKRSLARTLAWYTRSQLSFNEAVGRSLEEIVWSFDRLSANMVTLDRFSQKMATFEFLPMDVIALEKRLALSERRSAALAELLQKHLEIIRAQVKGSGGLQDPAAWDALSSRMEGDLNHLALRNSAGHNGSGLGEHRTAYVIGLFGTGRTYVSGLIEDYLGDRVRYFRDMIRLHPGPTPMIYSGHATLRHISRDQYPPEVGNGILEAVRSGFADLIFVYRHPIDSLLTNWIWWRTYIRNNRIITGISEVYSNNEDLCADLERNFSEFRAFAEGDPRFFAALPGPRFLSFPEFVEETELYLQAATLALRVEDFAIDPLKELSKIFQVMSIDLDSSRLRPDPPRATPYRYLAVQEKVPRFRDFIDGLSASTKRGIENMGYKLTV